MIRYGKIIAVSLVNSPERILWSTLIMIWYTLHKLLHKRCKRLPLSPNYQVPTHSPDIIFIILVSLLDLLGVLAGVRTPPAILKPVPHNMDILQNKKNTTLNYKYTNIGPWGMINDNQLYCVCVRVYWERGLQLDKQLTADITLTLWQTSLGGGLCHLVSITVFSHRSSKRSSGASHLWEAHTVNVQCTICQMPHSCKFVWWAQTTALALGVCIGCVELAPLPGCACIGCDEIADPALGGMQQLHTGGE